MSAYQTTIASLGNCQQSSHHISIVDSFHLPYLQLLSVYIYIYIYISISISIYHTSHLIVFSLPYLQLAVALPSTRRPRGGMSARWHSVGRTVKLPFSSLSIYIYIIMHTYICIYIYIYINCCLSNIYLSIYLSSLSLSFSSGGTTCLRSVSIISIFEFSI